MQQLIALRRILDQLVHLNCLNKVVGMQQRSLTWVRSSCNSGLLRSTITIDPTHGGFKNHLLLANNQFITTNIINQFIFVKFKNSSCWDTSSKVCNAKFLHFVKSVLREWVSAKRWILSNYKDQVAPPRTWHMHHAENTTNLKRLDVSKRYCTFSVWSSLFQYKHTVKNIP